MYKDRTKRNKALFGLEQIFSAFINKNAAEEQIKQNELLNKQATVIQNTLAKNNNLNNLLANVANTDSLKEKTTIEPINPIMKLGGKYKRNRKNFGGLNFVSGFFDSVGNMVNSFMSSKANTELNIANSRNNINNAINSQLINSGDINSLYSDNLKDAKVNAANYNNTKQFDRMRLQQQYDCGGKYRRK